MLFVSSFYISSSWFAASGITHVIGFPLPKFRTSALRRCRSQRTHRGAWQPARLAALNSLLALNDPRLDGALALAVRDAGLESSDLLNKIEKQLCKRKVRLTLP